MRVSQERTLEGRLFEIAGAAKRKPRAQNEMLRVTDRRLAELHGGFTDIHGIALWVIVAILNLRRS